MPSLVKSVRILNKFVIGIDTSNYKTSVAAVDIEGNLLFERSEFLDVKKGRRGLRQQEAFFVHSRRMPYFIKEMLEEVEVNKIAGVAVSIAPRAVEGSYMPVFTAGANAAGILSSALEVPIYTFSHQEGHIESVMRGRIDDPIDEECIIFHLSGGTTEALKCKSCVSEDGEIHYDTKIIGGTKDISIGQLIDRVGVSLGYEFPAGGNMDRYAVENAADLRVGAECSDIRSGKCLSPVKIKEGWFNLSGMETELLRKNDSSLIPDLFERLAVLLWAEAKYLSCSYGIRDIYICGGVAQSEYIRGRLAEIASGSDINIIFGDKHLSGDNAVGVARLGSRSLSRCKYKLIGDTNGEERT